MISMVSCLTMGAVPPDLRKSMKIYFCRSLHLEMALIRHDWISGKGNSRRLPQMGETYPGKNPGEPLVYRLRIILI